MTISTAQVEARQSRFLAAYAVHGRISEAAAVSEITVACVENWQKLDLYGFQNKLLLARRLCTERWESVMDERLLEPQGNRGSDPLLMFKLKALDPGKYREDIKVIDGGQALQTWEALKALAAQSQPRLSGDAPVTVEGEVREVEDGGSG